MKKHNIGKNVVVKFDGYRDMASHCDANRDTSASSSKTGNDSYYGTKTFDEARNLFVDGWDGPLQTIDTIRERVRERMGTIDTQVLKFDVDPYGVSGIDVGLWGAGDPNCFYQFYEDPEKRATKFVRVLVDTSVSWTVPTEHIKIRGAAIVALCDALNLCGYTTEVWAVSHLSSFGGRGAKATLSTLFPVQEVGQPWDVRSAMFAIAHPSFLRRMVFATMESLTDDERDRFGARDGSGYGIPLASETGSLPDVHCGGADIICQSSHGSIDTIVRDPVKWVLSQCKNMGVLTDAQVN